MWERAGDVQSTPVIVMPALGRQGLTGQGVKPYEQTSGMRDPVSRELDAVHIPLILYSGDKGR